ncbi:hypothetical protein AB0383_19480 [Amycolatopsis sp. NPDC051373]|uniref:hypothetical protein n=1 Tax=Amycolatopsis sp. NPDC051373 TaxID=3155801 RepID=UPI00344E7810
MRGRWTLVLPENLDGFAWAEAADRGVLLHVALDHAGRRFPAIVYDPYRIVQDADLVNESAPFYEPNVVLVPEVTREQVARGGDRLGRSGERDWLLRLGPGPESAWSLDVPDGADWTRIGELGTLSASLRCGERRFPVTFHDLRRLAEAVGWDDLDDLVHRRKEPRPVEFFEKNFIVIPALTKDAAEQAVAELGRRRGFAWLLD